MKLSVIVPVYNVEVFLEKCIFSIYQQDLSHDAYEIIAVNDGSTDSSPEVLKRLQETVVNLKIVHQENRGLSGARNSGFDAAQGDYIICVDSDDYLLPNTLEFLTSQAIEKDLDILEFAAHGVDEQKKTVYVASNTSNGEILRGEAYLSKIRYMNSACNKVYKRSFLNEHELRFMEGVYIEDIEFNSRAVFYANRVEATDYVAAHFLQRMGSITRTQNFKKKEKMIYDIYKVIHSINTFTEHVVTEKSIAYIALKQRLSSLVSTLLLRVLKDCTSFQVKKEIISSLRIEKLYPTSYRAETKSKQTFLIFSNQYYLFSICAYFYTLYNRLRYEK